MKVFGKPVNKWGWVRVTGCVVLAGMVLWMVLAAGLRIVGDVSWMMWSGYQTFSLMDGVERAVIPLLAVMAAGWLEEQDWKMETEQVNHREAEQAVAAQRREIIKRVHEALHALLPDVKHSPVGTSGQVGLRISEVIQAALAELDGKGKGEMLHFLFEKGLLTGEMPGLDWNGMDFSGATLPKAQLNGLCLEKVNLAKARIGGSHLVRGRFSGADLEKVFLQHADLREAVLVGSNLRGAHLEGANLEGADLRGARLEGAFLAHANLMNCALDGFPGSDPYTEKKDTSGSPAALAQSILIETILPDGRKVTNDKGKEYLQKKEMAFLIDRL